MKEPKYDWDNYESIKKTLEKQALNKSDRIRDSPKKEVKNTHKPYNQSSLESNKFNSSHYDSYAPILATSSYSSCNSSSSSISSSCDGGF